MIAVESLLFLLGGFVLAFVLIQLFVRPPETARDRVAAAVPVVKLLRLAEFPDSHEETQLLINDRVILSVSDQGLRQDAYTAEAEHLEAVATTIAAALGVSVQFSRLSAAGERRDRSADDSGPNGRPPARSSSARKG